MFQPQRPEDSMDNHHESIQQASSSSDCVSELVATILVCAEELRRHVSTFDSTPTISRRPRTGDVMKWRGELDAIVSNLDVLRGFHAESGRSGYEDSTNEGALLGDLLRGCHAKALQAARQAYAASLRLIEPTDQDCDDQVDGIEGELAIPLDVRQLDGQAAIARMSELLLELLLTSGTDDHPLANCVEDGQRDPDDPIGSPDGVIQAYAQYQRQVIRQRAKPCIAELVTARRELQERQQAVQRQQQQQWKVLSHLDDATGDEKGASALPALLLPPSSLNHAATIANILGIAAQLIHPLSQWNDQLHFPPQQTTAQFSDRPTATESISLLPLHLRDLCRRASTTVDEQAASLVVTIAGWMADDCRIDEWMERSARGGSVIGSYGNENVGGDVDKNEGQPQAVAPTPAALDGLVEELAFACHAVRRYLALVHGAVAAETGTAKSDPLLELLQEWTWKYAALERYLALLNWRSALDVAQPTPLVLGTRIRVPSFVEDAHYLSMRALQRAATTAQSALAVGTVAHALSRDVWSASSSTDHPGSSDSQRGYSPADGNAAPFLSNVCDALDRYHGCDEGMQRSQTDPRNPDLSGHTPRSGDFAAALLQALDHDDAAPASPASHSRRRPNSSAPTSGNFLALIGLHGDDEDDPSFQQRLDIEFCALNGVHAAATACRDLASFLDALLNPVYHDDDHDEPHSPAGHLEMDAKSQSMIQLAREELIRSSQAYDQRLESQIAEAVQIHSHSLVLLRDFLEREDYEITPSKIADAESDERLERDMMGPLRSSPFLRQVSNSLQAEVCWNVGEELTRVIVENVIFHMVWSRELNDDRALSPVASPKRFTDLGALLLGKQVRILQGFVSEVVSDPEAVRSSSSSRGAMHVTVLPNFALWERLSQVLTALQLEKPSDWIAHSYHGTSSLSLDELQKTFSLRADFSLDAVNAVVAQVSKRAQSSQAADSM
jgi:hypothetical protein